MRSFLLVLSSFVIITVSLLIFTLNNKVATTTVKTFPPTPIIIEAPDTPEPTITPLVSFDKKYLESFLIKLKKIIPVASSPITPSQLKWHLDTTIGRVPSEFSALSLCTSSTDFDQAKTITDHFTQNGFTANTTNGGPTVTALSRDNLVCVLHDINTPTSLSGFKCQGQMITCAAISRY